MDVFEIDDAAASLEELVERAAAGEVIGIARNGALAALLVPLDYEPGSQSA